MKYKSIMEILDAENLSLTEMQEAFEEYLKGKNMTMYEFMATEEGQSLMELNDKARFEDPFPYEVTKPKQK